MYAAAASSTKEDQNKTWRCPECTYELTSIRKTKCGVCEALRPGLENGEQEKEEQEEELQTTPLFKSKAPRLEHEKRQDAATASRVSQTSTTLNPPGIVSRQARLLLVGGDSMMSLLDEIVENLAQVTTITQFSLEGNVEHVKRTRDSIIMRLKAGRSCVVYDNALSAERQAAWLKIAQRCNAACDIAVSSINFVQVSGFAEILLKPLHFQLMKNLYRSKSNETPSSVTPVSTSTNSNSGSSRASIEKANGSSPALNGEALTSSRATSAQKPSIPALALVDLTADSDDD